MCFALRLHMSAAPTQGGLTPALALYENFMTTESSKTSDTVLLLALAVVAFVYLGISGAFMCIGIMLLQRPSERLLGIAACVFAIVYFMVAFGYDIGKDMAVRDNARTVSEISVKSPLSEG